MKKDAAGCIILTALMLVTGIGSWSCASSSEGTLTIIAPASPGGGWDQTSRAMQQALRDAGLVRSVQVVNVPGAGGIIGLAQLVNSNAGNGDVLMATGLIMMGAVLTNNSPVTMEQSTPIARLTGECEVMVVPVSSPYRSLAEFIREWKKDPGKLAIAGGSAGGTDHMVAGLLAKEVGVPVESLNYLPHSGGGESVAAILGGHVAAGINGHAELAAFIESGQLRVLAITSDERLPGRDYPTFVEQGVDLVLDNWRGVAAAPGISEEQRGALERLMEQMHRSNEWKAVLEKNKWIDMFLAGPEYETFLMRENARVTGVLQSIGLVQ